MINLLQGDCLARMKEFSDSTFDAIICDPPYGFEFQDQQSWLLASGFSQAGSSRFAGFHFPSYGSVSSENRICRLCKGTERGKDRVGFHKCKCENPDFPLRKTLDIGRQLQSSHLPWLREAYRVLKVQGGIKVFSHARMFHRLCGAMEEAGFSNLRLEGWGYGSGFPKVGLLDEAPGWGTALKPAWEPVVIGRKLS